MERWSRGVVTLVAAIAALFTWAGVAPAAVRSTSHRVPLPAGMAGGALDDVSCAGSQFCVAVGTGGPRHGGWGALIERWNGRRWIAMAAAEVHGPKPRELLDVDCHSASDCVAVGYAKTKHGSASVIEHWNGSYWSEVPNPDPKGQPDSQLDGVSCPASEWCMAVGSSATRNGVSHALVKRWNGNRWSILRIRHWDGASDTQLLGIDCPSTHSCFAVGITYGGDSPVTQHWNGHTWSPYLPQDDDYSWLGGVFCLSLSDCLAAGGMGDSSGDWTYVTQWNGHAWNILDSASWNAGELYDAACSHRLRFCVAVGDNVEIWSGGKTWSDRPLSNWTLLGIACAKRMCMAVGENDDNNPSPVSMLVRDR